MPELTQIIKGVRMTEKGTRIEKLRQYVLHVARDANKLQIKQATEAMFNVEVTNVNTQRYQGKWRRLTGRWGRRAEWKKAIITVSEGQKIELK